MSAECRFQSSAGMRKEQPLRGPGERVISVPLLPFPAERGKRELRHERASVSSFWREGRLEPPHFYFHSEKSQYDGFAPVLRVKYDLIVKQISTNRPPLVLPSCTRHSVGAMYASPGRIFIEKTVFFICFVIIKH